MKTEFWKLLTELNAIPNINDGGCGYAAKLIHDFLLDDSQKPTIVCLYKPSVFMFAPDLNHFCVKTNGKYYDSTGVLDRGKWNKEEEFSYSTLCLLLDDPQYWNKDFDRSYINQ